MFCIDYFKDPIGTRIFKLATEDGWSKDDGETLIQDYGLDPVDAYHITKAIGSDFIITDAERKTLERFMSKDALDAFAGSDGQALARRRIAILKDRAVTSFWRFDASYEERREFVDEIARLGSPAERGKALDGLAQLDEDISPYAFSVYKRELPTFGYGYIRSEIHTTMKVLNGLTCFGHFHPKEYHGGDCNDFQNEPSTLRGLQDAKARFFLLMDGLKDGDEAHRLSNDHLYGRTISDRGFLPYSHDPADTFYYSAYSHLIEKFDDQHAYAALGEFTEGYVCARDQYIWQGGIYSQLLEKLSCCESIKRQRERLDRTLISCEKKHPDYYRKEMQKLVKRCPAE